RRAVLQRRRRTGNGLRRHPPMDPSGCGGIAEQDRRRLRWHRRQSRRRVVVADGNAAAEVNEDTRRRLTAKKDSARVLRRAVTVRRAPPWAGLRSSYSLATPRAPRRTKWTDVTVTSGPGHVPRALQRRDRPAHLRPRALQDLFDLI